MELCNKLNEGNEDRQTEWIWTVLALGFPHI